MCGFVALFSFTDGWDRKVLTEASQSMIRRGPDDFGEWWSDNKRVGMAHRRLSIIDLNHSASQPMESSNTNYIIVFNGEIYNYKQLRGELKSLGVKLNTHSDTEVILELYAIFGDKCLKKLRGMFSFAIWNKSDESLFLARDPYGIKPLYFAKSKKGFLIASQVKALMSTGVISKKGCPKGQGGYWLLGSVPEPYTWFKDIKALPAGCCMQIDKHGVSKKYWHSISGVWLAPNKRVDKATVIDKVKHALYDSVNAHLVSDVPIGVFLSGGIDSTSLVAIMNDLGVSNIIGITLKYSEFEGSESDETGIASLVAKRYGVNHHIRVVSKSEFREDLPKIFSAMDQPSIDGINTWYASKCASELGLKVVISGVGGDELFQGYDSFRIIPAIVRFWRFASIVPGVKKITNFLMNKKSIRSKNLRWNLFSSLVGTISGAWFLQRSIFTPKELNLLMEKNLADNFLKNFSIGLMLKKMTGKLSKESKPAISQIESTCYLKNQLLRDCDWASMYHGVELRTPLVDSKLLSDLQPYLNSFSMHKNKSLLSCLLDPSLRKIITKRKKTGFGIPTNQWMKRSLLDFEKISGSRGWAIEVSKNIYKEY